MLGRCLLVSESKLEQWEVESDPALLEAGKGAAGGRA